MRCIQTALQKNRRHLAFLVLANERERVTDELLDIVEWRIENEVRSMRALALQEVEATTKVRITAIGDIAGERFIADTACGFDNVADTATRVPNRLGEFFN